MALEYPVRTSVGQRAACVAALAAVLTLSPVALGAGRSAGFVDGETFIDMCGDEAVRVEVSIPKGIIQAFSGFDDDLHDLAAGLESIHAIIIALERCESDGLTRARDKIREIDRALVKRGWERLARIRENDAEVKILVLTEKEVIQGLALLVIDLSDEELIFANIAGALDLGAIQRIGESIGMPGVEHIPRQDDDDTGR